MLSPDEFGYTDKYVTKNSKPWFPVMGEIHYSRYPKEYWKESLYKMKAGGVQVVSSYVIWIHHEEIENEYDFSGNKDLKEFIKTCGECGLYMFLRIGPWCHGEVRNGGFPDWLLKKDFLPRTNDQKYFDTVKRFYSKIYDEAKGLLVKDGGPIIGLQIENEYGHCGGLAGKEGEKHMQTLLEMAKNIGFNVPLYTATGWGGAVTGGMLPVMGGYCDAPWDQRLIEIEPSGNYIFTHERNDHNIGSDHSFGHGITFDISKFPFLTAELGGGLQVTHHRRPVATAEDIGAMSLVKLGSGVNLLGYYMYHGGTNPKGKLSTLQESRATGYANDLPELSYDFNAPIKEYGQISETLKEIKLLSMFVKDFGEELCEMPAYIPEDNPLHPDNYNDLRYSLRHNGKSGYIFVNNYQRRRKMSTHNNIILNVRLEGEAIDFPAINVLDGEYFFYPFNMKIGGSILKKALSTPLCKINNDYVFYGDKEPYYDFDVPPEECKIITLSKSDAKNSWKIALDKEYLFICDGAALQTDTGVQIIGNGCFKAYPELLSVPEAYEKTGYSDGFAVYEPKSRNNCQASALAKPIAKNKYIVQTDIPSDINDCFLIINYEGDSAKLYIGSEMIADNFYTGQSWEIGLKKFNFPKMLVLEIAPLNRPEEVFLETKPTSPCRLIDVTAAIEFCRNL